MPADDIAVPRNRLNLAAGVLMARHHLGSRDAYALIMDRARMTERSVGAVVDQVIRQARHLGDDR